jgi:hypothetical protein
MAKEKKIYSWLAIFGAKNRRSKAKKIALNHA